MTYIETEDGTQLFVKDWGSGQPVVLVSGWCINCDSWEYVMNELPHHGLRCIAYDSRGCGRSDQPWTGYDYDTLADDLAALLEQLNLHDAILVGHSMGSGVVVRYLTRHGDKRVARAVLISTTTPMVQQTADNLHGFASNCFEEMVAAIKQDRARYVASLAPAFFGVEAADENVSQEMIDWAVALTLQASPHAAIELLRTNFYADQREELKNMIVPTLIVHGSADQSTPLQITSERTHELLPNSQLIVYEGKPHGIYISEAKRLNQDLLAFINAA
jgi:pimeloyl-ACP methyl ester carboxylesterase